jgi:hypothetical protein
MIYDFSVITQSPVPHHQCAIGFQAPVQKSSELIIEFTVTCIAICIKVQKDVTPPIASSSQRNEKLRLGPLLLIGHTHSTLLPLLSLGSLIDWDVRIWIWTIVLLDISFSALYISSIPDSECVFLDEQKEKEGWGTHL